ncbi:MAG: SDR family NAD(P)-dependent oxidoreductase [Promethearchaeota archaeon]
MDFSDFFKEKVILVCGGTGSIGSEIVYQLLKWNPKTIRILSNSENELWKTKLRFKEYKNKLRFLLGDIRNFERIERALENVDYTFNAAAIKHVPIAEYNPMETINVNIHGLENIIEAALKYNVKNLIHISTDKAVNPTTVMGATKMLGERLCISRELAKGTHLTKISCVRFGNVLGTRGSILLLIKDQIKKGNIVTLTDEEMRRFFLSISQAVELVLKAASLAKGGEIFVLKMPVVLIKDLIEVVIEEYAPKIGKDPNSIKIETIGIRPGEKINEELISSIELSTCYETEEMYCIYPTINSRKKFLIEENAIHGAKIILNEDFHYNTKNVPLLNKEQIKSLLNKYNLI